MTGTAALAGVVKSARTKPAVKAWAWNLGEHNLSIVNLKDVINGMVGKDSTIDMINVSREDLHLIKSALDVYCNIGEQVRDMSKSVEDLKGRMESQHRQLHGEIVQKLPQPVTPPSPNQWSGLSGSSAGTTAASIGAPGMVQYTDSTGLSPYDTPEAEMTKMQAKMQEQPEKFPEWKKSIRRATGC